MKPFIQQTESKEYEKCPKGQHIARLVGIIDLGTQTWAYQGDAKSGQKLYLLFEVYAEDEQGNLVVRSDDGTPFLIGKEFSSSLNSKSNLFKFITSWRGKELQSEDFPFDFSRMLGKYCLMSVTHSTSQDGSKSYANIATIALLPKKMSDNLPKPVALPFFFDLDAEDFQAMEVLYRTRMWQGIQNKIALSPEWMRRTGSAPLPPVAFSNGSNVSSGASSSKPSKTGNTNNTDDFEDDPIPF